MVDPPARTPGEISREGDRHPRPLAKPGPRNAEVGEAVEPAAEREANPARELVRALKVHTALVCIDTLSEIDRVDIRNDRERTVVSERGKGYIVVDEALLRTAKPILAKAPRM